MNHKIAIAILMLAFLPSVASAKKPVTVPQQGQVVYVDANGNVIGDAQTRVDAYYAYVYFDLNEKLYLASIFQGELGPYQYNLYNCYENNCSGNSGHIYYDQPSCTGNAYVMGPGSGPQFRLPVAGVEFLQASREGYFYVPNGDTPQTVNTVSQWAEPFPRCLNLSETLDLYPAALLIDTSAYVKPYQLKVAPRP